MGVDLSGESSAITAAPTVACILGRNVDALGIRQEGQERLLTLREHVAGSRCVQLPSARWSRSRCSKRSLAGRSVRVLEHDPR